MMTFEPQVLLSHSAEETFKMGEDFGKQLAPNSVICFFGELAAGKTTFIKGVASGAAHLNPSDIQSPTFTYLNIYEGTKTIFHFDLYRLRDVDEFLSMGFDEYFDADGICCIEWSERIASCLPSKCIQVSLSHQGEDSRRITIV
jgi:tRNA threonylcarbamoyladenosine biosynthesis protein TsaE